MRMTWRKRYTERNSYADRISYCMPSMDGVRTASWKNFHAAFLILKVETLKNDARIIAE